MHSLRLGSGVASSLSITANDVTSSSCQTASFHPIPRFLDLKKMRFRAPGLNVGKSGGYRLIYRAKEMDEAVYVVFMETCFKGDCEHPSQNE